jgi:hypothetical protein
MILSVTVGPDDNLECAVEAGSDFLVMSDKHLLRLGKYQGIEMVRPVDFLQRGLRRGELLGLRVDSIQSREEHWVIADLLGKAGTSGLSQSHHG